MCIRDRYQYIYKRKHLYRIEGLLIHINDLKKYENQLLEISRKDGLTYLYNKVTVEEMIKNEIENLKQGTLLTVSYTHLEYSCSRKFKCYKSC